MLARTMGREQVPFPQDCTNWLLVRDLLTDLQEHLLNETINAYDAALRVQIVYEACQASERLDERWVQRRQDTSSRFRHWIRSKLDQSYLWYGMLKFLKKVERDESEKFLFSTLPNIIELALSVEENMPPGRLCFSQQQKGGSTVLSRQFIASILACSFLCLFPERFRDRTSKLNVINFTSFFKHLPQLSQVAKLRCILHYFERTEEDGLERPGTITFHRQVADRSMLPTLDDLTKSETVLCALLVHTEGVIEDVGSSAIQVDFANRSIGGGVLGRGRVQEEIRFSTCPELIAAMLFMENMEENEAIVITGFEQFTCCTGHAATLEFAGPFYDKAERDSSGNLLNTLCAIDATSFRYGGKHRQYMESFLLREVCKALVGFSRMGHQRTIRLRSAARGMSSEWEEEFVTASESVDGERVLSMDQEVDRAAEVMAKSLLSQGMVGAVRVLTGDHSTGDILQSLEEVEPLPLDDVSLLSGSSDSTAAAHSSSTPRDEATQVPREEEMEQDHGHGYGGNGERLSLPVAIPRPQNGSSDLLEVDYSEWLANFRRRSSQLSDVTSRRSSSSTKHSSEFSSDLEEIYETLVQAEKAQHGVIEEENYGTALTEYAAHFVTSLVEEGTSTAAQMLPGMKDFEQGRPPAGIIRPQVIRPMAMRFGGVNGSSDLASGTEGESKSGSSDVASGTEGESNSGSSDVASGTEGESKSESFDLASGSEGAEHHGAGGEDHHAPEDSPTSASFRPSEVKALPRVLAYISSLVDTGVQGGVAEAAAATKSSKTLEDIPDEVYRWFANKIVQEVFAHVTDELCLHRVPADKRWQADQLEAQRGHSLSDSDSASSSGSSSSETRQESSSFSVSGAAGRRSCDAEAQSGRGGGREMKGKITSPSSTSSQGTEAAVGQRLAKSRTAAAVRTHPLASEAEGVELKGPRTDEWRGIMFAVERARRWSGASTSDSSDTASGTVWASSVAAPEDVPAGFRSPRSKVSHLFVVKDVPVPVTRGMSTRLVRSPLVKDVTGSRSKMEGDSSRSTEKADGSRSSGVRGDRVTAGLHHGVGQSGDERTSERDVEKTSSSSASLSSSLSFVATATSSIPKSCSVKTETRPSPYPVSQAPSRPPHATPVLKEASQTTSALCDNSDRPADSTHVLPTSDSLVKDPKPGAFKPHLSLSCRWSSSSEGKTPSVPSNSGAVPSVPSAEQTSGLAAAAHSQTNPEELDQGATSEQGAAAGWASQDLNLDCYRAAAAIVNQVFQSLPDHLSQSELRSLQGSSSSFYYQGRKYESIISRGSCETAAAVIGASEKGNVVSESHAQSKAVTGAANGGTTSPRRTRSQSPCFSWLSKRLSRETLTNAFVKVESRQTVKSYERRSSEPCQRSVTLSLQAFNTSCCGYSADSAEDRWRKNARTDDDLQNIMVDSWRRGSLDSISLSRRRSSCGFKDPVLSRFAQELITADTSVPQLYLVDSESTTSTTGSRRSSLSGFRDTTLATFESELLNSSFTLNQAATSPRHRRSKGNHSRESRLWKSDSSETEYWFPIPRRVGHEFQEQMELVQRHYSVDEVEDYADFVTTTIFQQAVGLLCDDGEKMTQQDRDINIFSENLADQILRAAMLKSARITAATASASGSIRRRRRGKPKSVSDSELDFSVSSNDLTARSLEDRLTDFQDALDVSYDRVEAYAGNLADVILSDVFEEFGAAQLRLVPGCRAIASGNWGCGAFCGDPYLKVVLQWVAASLARAPRLVYFTFGDPRLQQLPAVVEMLSQQRWTVGQLMTAVRAYSMDVLDEFDWGGDASGRGGGGDGDGFVPSQTLFDFLLMQP